MARVLVVDDEEPIRKVWASILGDRGHLVTAVESGQAALGVLAASEQDVLVVDILMPQMSGLELLPRVRRLTPTVKIILVTGAPSVETASEAVRLGAFDYLSKPVRAEALVRAVDAAALVKALEAENRSYRLDLERMVEERTRQLRESERRFHDMLARVNLVAVMLDRQGRLIFCNEHLEKVTGWSSQDVLGRDWFVTFLPESQAERVRAVFESGLATGELPTRFENPIKTRSGQQRLIRWSNSILRSPNGEIVGSASIGEDVTESRRAEEAARARERSYVDLVEQLPDALLRFDRALRLLFANRSAAGVLGRSVAEGIGKSVRELGLSESQAQLCEDAVASVLASGAASESIQDDEGGGTIEWRFFPERQAEGGAVSGVLVVARERGRD
jgi:PAS domain S-box-containing protein